MFNLLHSARTLLAPRHTIAAALTIFLFAAAAKADPLGPVFTLNSTTVTFLTNSGGSITDTNLSLGSAGSNPLQLFTNAPITIDSSTWTNNDAKSYVITWTGSLDPSLFPIGGTFIDNEDISITFSSPGNEMVNWTFTGDVGNQFHIGSFGFFGGDLVPGFGGVIGGSGSSHGISSIGVTPRSSSWSLTLTVTWSGFTSPETMTILIPEAKPISLGVAPEPASLSLLAAALPLLLKRRR